MKEFRHEENMDYCPLAIIPQFCLITMRTELLFDVECGQEKLILRRRHANIFMSEG